MEPRGLRRARLPIPNAAERYAFTSDTIARSADGRFVVLLRAMRAPATGCRRALPGGLVLVLTVLDPRGASLVTTAGPDAERLPVIKRFDRR